MPFCFSVFLILQCTFRSAYPLMFCFKSCFTEILKNIYKIFGDLQNFHFICDMKGPITYHDAFTSDFGVSVVMPFYKRIFELKQVFPVNSRYFARKGIEVIIVMDSPEGEEELLDFIRTYPDVNWRVIVNRQPHSWRNPAKPLNVGLRYATKDYVMVCSPESEMLTDVIYLLRKTFQDYAGYPHYAVGRVSYADQEDISYEDFDSRHYIPFGSIMARRSDLIEIGGYDETFTEWGGDDNNIRARLNQTGVHELYVEKAMMIHRDFDNMAGKKRRTLSIEKLTVQQLRHFFYPSDPKPNAGGWGNDFDCVIFDYLSPPSGIAT